MHPHRQSLIDWAIKHNYKFTNRDTSTARKAPVLREVAADFVREYAGKTRFVINLKPRHNNLTAGQSRAVLNIMVDEYTPPDLPQIPNGRYTVVLDKELGVEYTFELSDCPEKFSKPEGTQIISMLVGPDNENDYQGVGVVLPGRHFAPWSKTKGQPSVLAAANVLCGAEDYIQHGETYALKSGRCWRCHRTLTRSESIIRGLGPHCAKILGITTSRVAQPVQQAVLRTRAGDVVMNVSSDGVRTVAGAEAIEKDLFDE